MSVVFGLLLGVVAALMSARLLNHMLGSPVLQRENYRGAQLSIGGGLVALFASLLAVTAVAVVRQLTGSGSLLGERSLAMLFVFVAFGLLGFIDDTVGNGDSRGFRGHLRALMHGQVTTGLLKLAGGAAVAWIAIDRPGLGSFRIALGVAVIALSANLCNLFDRAPARSLKVALVVWSPLMVAGILATRGASASGIGNRPALVVASICVGCCLGLLPFDAQERLMIGDAGANALGAVLGAVVVLTQSSAVQLVVLLGAAALNLLSEFISFSSTIARVRWLNWLDQFGTRRTGESSQ